MNKEQLAHLQVVPIDFADLSVPASVKEFTPVLFRDGETDYCCLLGDDPQSGIFGCGPTKQKALNDWDNDFTKRLSLNEKNDGLVQHILDTRKKKEELDEEWVEDYNEDPDEQSFGSKVQLG